MDKNKFEFNKENIFTIFVLQLIKIILILEYYFYWMEKYTINRICEI